jgi:hypothetical protein
VPIATVYDTVRSVLYFLPDSRVKSVCRCIEDGAVIIKPNGEVLTNEGNKVIIRRAMRQALKVVRDPAHHAIS